MNWRLIATVSALIAISCAGGDFAGSGGKKGEPKPVSTKPDVPSPESPDGGGDGKGGKSGKDGDDGNSLGNPSEGSDGDPANQEDQAGGKDDGDLFTDDEIVQNPKPCTAAAMVQVPVGKECPRNFALYTMDDMSSKAQVPGNYVCCALPSGDILSKKKDKLYQRRSRRCNANEVMTGAADQAGNIMCSEINTQKYSLTQAKLVCAGEQGALFGIGAKDCGGSSEIVSKDSLPANIRALVIGPLGEDGCVTVPHGSLVIQQGGRRCDDAAASTLVFKDSGQPVKIFP